MTLPLRGRPPLAITLWEVVDAVHRHRQVRAAAHELGCSDAYIHVRLKAAGLGRRQVLEAATVEGLLNTHGKEQDPPGQTFRESFQHR